MGSDALSQVALGYQLLWNRQRALAGVALTLDPDPNQPVDVPQLLGALTGAWSAGAPQLLLCTASPRLLANLLTHAAEVTKATTPGPWLQVPEHLLRDPAVLQAMVRAHQRGVTLVWRGEPGRQPSPALAPYFARSQLTLTAEQALRSLRASPRAQTNQPTPRSNPPAHLTAHLPVSPLQPAHIYEGLASRALVEHALDEQQVWAVAGWPTEDVMHGYRQQQVQAGHSAVADLMEALDADDAMEAIEERLGEDPVLAYRFLRFANSAAFGLRTQIGTLRHGLMVVGLSRLRGWLQEQLPHASHDLNLQPVRLTQVIRARLMALLLNAGQGDDLGREVYACGLLSQIDLLLGEPLSVALPRIRLPERVSSAMVGRAGPYLAYLDVARALECAPDAASRKLYAGHAMALSDINRALLYTLAHARLRSPRGLLVV